MYFSIEQIEKAKNASSAQELLEIAAKEGIELSVADAKTYYDFLAEGNRQLTSEELKMVAGGKHDGPTEPDPKYHVGQFLLVKTSNGGYKVVVLKVLNYREGRGWTYRVRFLDDLTEANMDLEIATVIVL